MACCAAGAKCPVNAMLPVWPHQALTELLVMLPPDAYSIGDVISMVRGTYMQLVMAIDPVLAEPEKASWPSEKERCYGRCSQHW